MPKPWLNCIEVRLQQATPFAPRRPSNSWKHLPVLRLIPSSHAAWYAVRPSRKHSVVPQRCCDNNASSRYPGKRGPYLPVSPMGSRSEKQLNQFLCPELSTVAADNRPYVFFRYWLSRPVLDHSLNPH